MGSDFIIVKDPRAVGRKKWSKFMFSHEVGNIFHTPEYFDLCNSIPE